MGAVRGAFSTNVAPQCRAFSRALEIEKLKAPLFRGPKGAGDTNDWCIINHFSRFGFERLPIGVHLLISFCFICSVVLFDSPGIPGVATCCMISAFVFAT